MTKIHRMHDWLTGDSGGEGASGGEITGVVVRAYSGWYDVAVGGNVYEARPRGKLRRHDDSIVTGDRVKVTLEDDATATIEAVLPRENRLVRPAVANVNQIVIVFSLVQPEWSPFLTDRLAVLAESVPLSIVFCINKIDLVESGEDLQRAKEYYRQVGYPVVLTDAKSGKGIEELRELLRNRVTVFAGESGVGKSTILNSLQPDFQLATGTTSPRLGTGRHTTRHASLLALAAPGDVGEIWGYVVDTPGFRRVNVTTIEKHALARHFPEFREPSLQCRFDDCLHKSEPGCGVKQAVDNGQIHPTRYESYSLLLAEIEEYEANLYK